MEWKRYPKKISIMGTEFKITYVDTINPGSAESIVYGETEVNGRTIKINKAAHNTHAGVLRTLWHEAFHALVHVSGLSQFMTSELEEALVVALEHGMEGLFAQLGRIASDE